MMSDPAKACYDRFQENVALAARIEAQLPQDKAWSCVVRFYAALHLVSAYLIDKAQVRFDPASAEHTQRKKAIDRCPELRDTPKRYRQLKDLSESVRYDAGFKYTDAHHNIVQVNLDKIIGIVEPKIKKA